MRNDYDIYKMKSDAKSGSVVNVPPKSGNCRSRKTSEPPSMTTSPCVNEAFVNSPSHRDLSHVSSRNQFSRINSRTSQSSLIASPIRSASCISPPNPEKIESQNKFHNRLVGKLRKAFKRNGSSSEETRSWKSHSVDLSLEDARRRFKAKKPREPGSHPILMEMGQTSDFDDSEVIQYDKKFLLSWDAHCKGWRNTK